MKGLSRVKKKQLSGQVVEELVDWLSSDKITVGTKLPSEYELMSMLGVGRSTVRESVKIVAHLGYIDVRVGDGTYLVKKPADAEPFLSRLERADLSEIYSLKLGLEMQIAMLAAKNRDEKDLAIIKKSLTDCVQAHKSGDSEKFAAADFEFHSAISNAAKEVLLSEFYLTVRQVIIRTEFQASTEESMRERTLDIHQQLFEAIQSGNAKEAMDVWVK